MALWIVLVSVLARAMPLPRAHRIVAVRVRPHGPADRDRIATHLAGTLDALLRLEFFVFRSICWKRAMVLQRFLALNGIESRINFGVQKTPEGVIRGHAWLERDGQPFLENTAVAYVVTFSLPRCA